MRFTFLALLSAVLLGIASPVLAQEARNVLLVVNEGSPASQAIGAHYAAVRQIPPDNVLRIQTAGSDEIERQDFDTQIEGPIALWLTRRAAQDRILYIVLTKGIPLRVRGTTGLNGSVASVDSELTLLYRKLLGLSVPPGGRIPNPYYLGDQPLSAAKPMRHSGQDIYLVTRLDGFTVDDALKLVDHAAAPVKNGTFVFDQRANIIGDRNGDAWLAAAAKNLTDAGFGDRVLLDSTKTVVQGQKQVMGFYSWGSNDPAVTSRRLGLEFVPGALAGMFVSTDGRTFQQPPDTWNLGKWTDPKTFFSGSPQSLMGDLIHDGATGVAGNVSEPYLDAAPRPQIIFPAYRAGFNLAESFYLSMPYLSWQTIIVGDPLCAPFARQVQTPDELDPDQDPETELPRYFSSRRVALLELFGVRAEVSKLLLKASSRMIAGDANGARAPLEAVTRLEPHLNAAHFVLAGIYDQAGEHDKAIARYKVILESAPDDVRTLNNLAYTIAVNKQSPADALLFAERAYTLSNREVRVDLGYSVVVRKGTPEGALPFAQRAYDLAATKPQITDTLGWIHHLLGHEADAERYVSEALERAPSHPEIQYHLAEIDAKLGRLTQARAALAKAMELDPDLGKRDEVKRLSGVLNPR